MSLLSLSPTFGILGAAVFVFSACSVPENLSASAAQSSGRQAHRNPWMSSDSSSDSLVYAVGGCGGTCVLSYPSGELVGTLDTYGAAICSDNSGDVYITYNNEVIEYAHGGTSPITAYSLSGDQALGCSVDPTTENLAVVYRGQGADVAVFPNGGGTPTLYKSDLNSQYCGYDASGDLFVNGLNRDENALSELAYGGSSFTVLSISGTVPSPGQLQWDGTYLAWETAAGGKGNTVVARLQVSGKTATVVGTTDFRNIQRYATQSWIFGNRIIVPYENNGRRPYPSTLGVWKYPQGGYAVRRLHDFGDYKKKTLDFQGVAFSP